MGAYVKLLEYNGIEGMILMSEVSRRRIRSINKLLKVGRQEVALVLRVDKDKGYIDLSKRRVTPEDVARTNAKYTASKTVHSIMRHLSEKTGVPLEELLKAIAWPLYKRNLHASQAFQLAITDPEKAFEGLVIEPNVRAELLDSIRKRLTPQPIRMRADIDVLCATYEGVTALKRALKAGEACGTPETKITVNLVAPPLYVVICTALDKEAGLKLLDTAIGAIKAEITKSGGKFDVKIAPRVVSASDDSSYASMLVNLAKKAEETNGDDEEDSGSEDNSSGGDDNNDDEGEEE
jgi:translation initiation factor 2 subunit 1